MYNTLTTINFIRHVLYSMCQYQSKTIQRERDKREGERGTDSNRDTNIERNRKRERERVYSPAKSIWNFLSLAQYAYQCLTVSPEQMGPSNLRPPAKPTGHTETILVERILGKE